MRALSIVWLCTTGKVVHTKTPHTSNLWYADHRILRLRRLEGIRLLHIRAKFELVLTVSHSGTSSRIVPHILRVQKLRHKIRVSLELGVKALSS